MPALLWGLRGEEKGQRERECECEPEARARVSALPTINIAGHARNRGTSWVSAGSGRGNHRRTGPSFCFQNKFSSGLSIVLHA